ncbi:4936_t:CDS:2, partial [Racocetra persica]
PQSRAIESGTQQTVVPLQQPSQQIQPSYAYVATQTSYTSVPTPALNNATTGEQNSLSGTVHQGYAPQANSTLAYMPQSTYGTELGYQYQPQVAPQHQQSSYYQSSSQIHPQTQSQKLEEAPPLIEL